MEILQTLWNILITPNERLSNILICPFSFVEAYLYMLTFITLLKIETNHKQRILYTTIFALVAVINIIFVPYPYYTFVNVLACPILVLIIFKLNILTSILCEIVMYLVSILLTTPLILLYTYILKLPSKLITDVPIHRIIYSIFFYVLIYLFCKLCKKHNINIYKAGNLKTKLNTPFFYNFIIGTLVVGIQTYIQYLYIDFIPNYVVFLNLASLLIYFLISLYSLSRTNKLEITTEKLEAEKLYNQTLTVLYDNISGFKHDFNNIVQGIGGYISTNNIEGLKEYYTEILGDCQKINNLSLLSPKVINNPAIYSLLTYKYHEAIKLGIKVDLQICIDLSTINMKIYQFTRLFGILIDNAIEAAKQCDEKEIVITFRNNDKRKKQFFIIENTYINKDINIDEIFERGKTSKKGENSKNHGLGLWEVRQFIKKYKNLDLYTTKNDKYFKQQFEIYY